MIKKYLTAIIGTGGIANALQKTDFLDNQKVTAVLSRTQRNAEIFKQP